MKTLQFARAKFPQLSVQQIRTTLIQRQCACGQHNVAGGECSECYQKREGTLQRMAVDTAPATVPPIVHDVLNSPGQPLDIGARTFMEPRFGHDFSGVRVHTDARAAESARSVNALAYTVGRNVVFGMGQYVPETWEGKRLLAHELTHVVQQDSGSRALPVTLGIAESGNISEMEANLAAMSIMYEQPFTAMLNRSAAVNRQIADPVSDAERQIWLSQGKQSNYGVLDKIRRTPMNIQTGNQEADEILWTMEAILIKADQIRTLLKTKFGDDRDMRVTSVVKAGEHTKYRKMDIVPAGKTTWEELAAAAVHVGFWVHAEGVTLEGHFWPLSRLATGSHLDLYLIRQVGDFPIPSDIDSSELGKSENIVASTSTILAT